MRAPRAWMAVAASAFLSLCPAEARPQGPSIEHEGVRCIVADKFPGIEARFPASTAGGRARVFFKAAGTADWYFVEMKPEGERYRGILPKPQKSTKAIDYYVEALDPALRAARTAEFSPAVVSSAGECQGEALVAMALASAKVVVASAAGGAVLPAGFATSGVTMGTGAGVAAASGSAGGASTGLIVGVVAAGAVGGGLAVLSRRGGDDSGSPGPGGPPSGPVTLAMAFGPPPGIDATVCLGTPITFFLLKVTLGSDGSFDQIYPLTAPNPNILRASGRATATTFQGTITCASRPGPTGTLSASGDGRTYSGTFSFGTSQGTLTVTRE